MAVDLGRTGCADGVAVEEMEATPGDLISEVDNWQLKNVLMLQLIRDGMGSVKDLQKELRVPRATVRHWLRVAEGRLIWRDGQWVPIGATALVQRRRSPHQLGLEWMLTTCGEQLLMQLSARIQTR